jgi:hypothetical protein
MGKVVNCGSCACQPGLQFAQLDGCSTESRRICTEVEQGQTPRPLITAVFHCSAGHQSPALASSVA